MSNATWRLDFASIQGFIDLVLLRELLQPFVAEESQKNGTLPEDLHATIAATVIQLLRTTGAREIAIGHTPPQQTDAALTSAQLLSCYIVLVRYGPTEGRQVSEQVFNGCIITSFVTASTVIIGNVDRLLLEHQDRAHELRLMLLQLTGLMAPPQGQEASPPNIMNEPAQFVQWLLANRLEMLEQMAALKTSSAIVQKLDQRNGNPFFTLAQCLMLHKVQKDAGIQGRSQ